jgi:N-acetylglutamate synthase-like GNAT family acetyltransferase
LTIRIDYLADHPECIPTLAEWHLRQWSYLSPGDSIERRNTSLRRHSGRRQIPTTFVALADSLPIGCASLVEHDMDTRMQLSPWMASVYVDPGYRRQGTGSALVQRVVDEAQALAVATLYLYTPDKESFYSRLGWQVMERTLYRGYQQVVMSLQLASSQIAQHPF